MTRDDSGFSLLEALVATTLAAMLAAVLFGSVSIGARVMDASTQRTDAATQIAIVQNFLRNHLAQARPTFEGRPDALAFNGMALRTERTRDGLRLIATPETAPAHQSLLLERLASIEFAYFGSDDPMRAPAWHALWTNRNSVPTLVRLRVGFAGDRTPQDFVVALRLA